MSRATFAQWETGRHLPAVDRVQLLDDVLSGEGLLTDLASRARLTDRGRSDVPASPARAAPATRPLILVFSEVREALLRQMCRAADGRPTGWRHNLVTSPEPATVLSTAYGLKTMALLGGPNGDTRALVDHVLAKAVRDGDDRVVGWSARTQAAPRLEATATVLDGLLCSGAPIGVDDVLRMLERLLDETALQRPFVLTSALEPVMRVAPDSTLARQLIKNLLACRGEFDGVALWPEKLLDRDQPLLDPSVVHTARAVTALRTADDPSAQEAVAVAEDWLRRVDDLNGVSEIIRRDVEPEGDDQVRREELSIEHFTAAWYVRALAGSSAPAYDKIQRALGVVWSRYDTRHHFWAWGNGDVPVWMLNDTISALHAAALALHPTPVPLDP